MKKKKDELSKIDKLFLDAQKKLGSSNYSVKKMKEFLKKKGASKNETLEIISKLRKYSFLDEEEIVKDIISYADIKHYGYNKIITMLRSREIDEKLITKIKKDDSREEYQSKELVKSLVKRYKNKNTLNLKRNIYSALIRYGYDVNIASIRADEVYISPIEEINVLKLEYGKLLSSYSRKYIDATNIEERIKDKLISKGFRLNDIRKVEKELIHNYEMD